MVVALTLPAVTVALPALGVMSAQQEEKALKAITDIPLPVVLVATTAALAVVRAAMELTVRYIRNTSRNPVALTLLAAAVAAATGEVLAVLDMQALAAEATAVIRSDTAQRRTQAAAVVVLPSITGTMQAVQAAPA